MSYITLFCNTPDMAVANKLAKELVLRKAAACVNIVPNITSIYFWQNEIHQDSEFMLIIKSIDSNFESIKSIVKEIHPYDCPEIICFEIDNINTEYKNYLERFLLA